MADQKKEKVGYKNPPSAHRFRPGQSGNPAGRPKGRSNTKTIWRKCLNEVVEVSIRGRKQPMAMLEAMIRRVVQSAISGDLKALQFALAQAGLYDNDSSDAPEDPADEARRRALVEEIMSSLKGNARAPAAE